MAKLVIPEYIETEEQLEELFAVPSDGLVEDIAKLEGDIMILGAGGKIGPSMAKLAANAIKEAGIDKKIIAVDLAFNDEARKKELEAMGIELVCCDLLDEKAVAKLPDVKNILYLAGMKFGSTGNEAKLWAMNVYMPGMIASRFRESNLVEVSSGNVYGLNNVLHGGATEDMDVYPMGEYAISVQGRERMFEHFSRSCGTPSTCARLFYAIDMRYGIINDIAMKMLDGQTIDISMGNFNCIWQGDANDQILRCLNICDTPPKYINITGPEIVSLRWLVKRLSELLEIEAKTEGEEAIDCILGNTAEATRRFGYPRVALDQMVIWCANWAKKGGTTLGKPSKFQVRDGKF
ncbi:MAG: NAD-dependent epimerase/dehydratase family protein [Planctomycetota bacterium]